MMRSFLALLVVSALACGQEAGMVQIPDPTDGGVYFVPANDVALQEAVKAKIAAKQTGAVRPIIATVEGGCANGRCNAVPQYVTQPTCANGRCQSAPVQYSSGVGTFRSFTQFAPVGNCPSGRCPNR